MNYKVMLHLIFSMLLSFTNGLNFAYSQIISVNISYSCVKFSYQHEVKIMNIPNQAVVLEIMHSLLTARDVQSNSFRDKDLFEKQLMNTVFLLRRGTFDD